MAARIDQKALAERLGVSQMSISRALRNHPAVSPGLRARVLELAHAMDYRPNVTAAAMKSGKHGAIGLLLGQEDAIHVFPPQCLVALAQGCEAHGSRLVVNVLSEATFNDPSKLPLALRSWAVDGLVIVHSRVFSQPVQDRLDQLQLPSVWINADHADAIIPDDVAAVEDAVSRLADLGHCRIAYLTPIGEHGSIARRRRGYVSGIRTARLATCILHQDDDVANVDLADMILETKATALICYERWGGLRAFAGMLQRGFDVPRHLSIVCCGPSGFQSAGIDLTHELIPYASLGECAIDRLFCLINGGRLPRPKPVPFSFHAGRTIGPPRIDL